MLYNVSKRHKLLLVVAFAVVLLATIGYAPLHLSAWTPQPSDAIGPLVEYTDDVFRFTVGYPAGYIVRVYAEDEDGARTITFESPDDEHAYQIFVVPYAERTITPERFRTDAPSGVMIDPKETMIDGTPAKSFFGYNDQMGDTWEVWFIHGGFLYEVTTDKQLDAWLTPILQTRKFI